MWLESNAVLESKNVSDKYIAANKTAGTVYHVSSSKTLSQFINPYLLTWILNLYKTLINTGHQQNLIRKDCTILKTKGYDYNADNM